MAYDLAGVVHWLEQISSMVASANNAKAGFRPE
jgi:hypothetical protein